MEYCAGATSWLVVGVASGRGAEVSGAAGGGCGSGCEVCGCGGGGGGCGGGCPVCSSERVSACPRASFPLGPEGSDRPRAGGTLSPGASEHSADGMPARHSASKLTAPHSVGGPGSALDASIAVHHATTAVALRPLLRLYVIALARGRTHAFVMASSFTPKRGCTSKVWGVFDS
jgi:hypothetical protein